MAPQGPEPPAIERDWIEFPSDPKGPEPQARAIQGVDKKQSAQRMADLEQENQQLRDRLADSENRRIAAEGRVAYLEGTITHLVGLTGKSRVLDYSLTVEAEGGERMVWRSREAAREHLTTRTEDARQKEGS